MAEQFLTEDRTSEVMTVNMGPHHPATHGVLRLVVDLEGEVVRDLKPVIGYVHTGIEKSCEDKSYWKVIPFVERMDYVSFFFQMEAYCGASTPTWSGWAPQPSTSARSRCSGTASASATASSTSSRWRPASACTRATSRLAA
jgi:hypothetical protein